MTTVTLTMLDQHSVQVEISPFLALPNLVIWQDHVFLHKGGTRVPEYREGSFGTADAATEGSVALLESIEGMPIGSVYVPSPFPEVLRWCDRFFIRYSHNKFKEAYCTASE